MYDHRLSAFDQTVTIIHPGEYLVSREDIIISTVLGSCIAVAIRDEYAGIGGLNHFMLPGIAGRGEHPAAPKAFATEDAKYGMYAMELLINDLLREGCRRERLKSKVFGGAALLGFGSRGQRTVAEENIEFVMEFLAAEKIPILATDVGGNEARKILFFVKSGKVLLKRITGTLTKVVDQEESTYRERIISKPAGDIVLFAD
jgi:chemotaxis protein CheD